MPTKTNKRRDFSQVAFDIVQQATGEAPKRGELTGKKADSRKGGLAGGKARAKTLSPEKRSEIARKAAQIRWEADKGKDNGSQ